MKILAAIYRGFCVIEEIVCAVFVVAITFLIFTSAIARSLNHPLNWAPDTSLLLLAWVVFLGADVALRRSDFIRVDILMRKFSPGVKKFLYYLYYTVIIVFLGMLVRYGIPLAMENSRRNFQALDISYSWATISAPVGAVAMIITIIIKLVKKRKLKEIESEGKEAI
jgi:TRAP-type C4-dicarboxylate transport system permease small subunit